MTTAMQCPICKKPVPPKDPNAPKSTYPFCSERCQLVDLGRWLDGKYQIPVASEESPVADKEPDEAQ
jgi:hypothetical protein